MMKMKLSTSVLCVVVIAVFLSMIDFGEASCNIVCPTDKKYVCGQRPGEQRTFDNDCQIEKENKCGGGGWTIRNRGHCPTS
uniref:Salivary secreted kazal-type proteinase inhibitor n=1 Tax=Triatoma infestans TaxID=30076 RepID=A6YPP1_TRIIF|nr:salivary secreted kazal-type proteinase inhibitor [Triatoma infestans]